MGVIKFHYNYSWNFFSPASIRTTIGFARYGMGHLGNELLKGGQAFIADICNQRLQADEAAA
jgi:hypothetical protein